MTVNSFIVEEIAVEDCLQSLTSQNDLEYDFTKSNAQFDCLELDSSATQNIQLVELQSKYDLCAGMLTDCRAELIEFNNKCVDQQKRIDTSVMDIVSLRAEIDNQRNISALQVRDSLISLLLQCFNINCLI